MTSEEKELCARAREALAGEPRGVVAFAAAGEVAIGLVSGKEAAVIAGFSVAEALDIVSGILRAVRASCELAEIVPPVALLGALEALLPSAERCACSKCTAARSARN